MNRQQRSNLPSVDDVIARVNVALRSIARKEENGCLDVRTTELELESLKTNLLRVEGHDSVIPEEMLKKAMESIENVKKRVCNAQGAQVEETSSSRRKDNFECTLPNKHGRGRNVFDIDLEKLQKLIQMGFTVKQIARDGLLGGVLHPNTLYKRMKENSLKLHSSDISDSQLTTLIAKYNQDHANSGASEVQAYLKTQGIFVQRDKCRQLLASVDPVGTALRWTTTIQRREYSVPTANSVWHVDTHHSLIRKGIVVHGGIDGHSRLVTFLRAATCNNAKAAACFFVQGVNTFGMPSRVRADHGTEFADVGRFMTRVNGEERGSFLTGSSVHNQRIERLWRDVFCKVLDMFYKLFNYMEDRNIFNPDDDIHKWVLQFVFCPRVDIALKQWMHTHNSHKLRTENNRTPSMIWTQSLVEGDQSHTAIRNVRNPPNEAISAAVSELHIDDDDTQFQKPRVPCPLGEEQLQLLKSTVDILRNSDSHGLDIYGEVMTFVRMHQRD